MLSRPERAKPKTNQHALRVAEKMVKNGCSIIRLPPSEVTRDLSYRTLSTIIDLCIVDMCKVCPEIFDTNSPTWFNPTILKAYFYILAFHHFERSGVLIKTGGQSYPDATGYECPVPLLAWLQGIGPYSEGDVAAIATYTAPSAIALLGNDTISQGTPVETNLSLTGTNFTVQRYSPFNGEYQVITGSANANNVIQQWIASASAISSALRSFNYPTRPMWGEPPAVPDGSFWGMYSNNLPIRTNPVVNHPLFTCPFIKWDVEVAQLYTTSTEVAGMSNPGWPGVTRHGVMANEYPLNGYGTLYADALECHHLAFMMVLRNCTYYPGMPTIAMRSWHGDQLERFMPVPIQIDFGGYQEVVARCISQRIANGATNNSTQVLGTLILHAALARRRIQPYELYSIDSANWQRNLVPSSVDNFTGIAGVVQLLNDLGPVVVEGRLHCPLMSNDIGNFYINWNTFGVAGALGGLYQFGLLKAAGASDPAITWRGVGTSTNYVLNAGWITTYVAGTGYLFSPWQCLGACHELMIGLLSSGDGYGKGDLDYPVSRGPRGSIAMLAKSTNQGGIGSLTDPDPVTGYSFIYNPLKALISNHAIGGTELVMAAIARWSWVVGTYGNWSKYGRNFIIRNGDAFVDRYCSNVMSPGGTFLDHLSEAGAMRHGPRDLDMGLATPGDNADACLWDAIKKVAGTVAQTLQPAVSEAAKIGCGSVPGVGQFIRPMCGEVARSLTTYIADTARVSSNRQAKEPLSRGLLELEKIVDAAPKYSVGVTSAERRPIKPLAAPAGPKPGPRAAAPRAATKARAPKPKKKIVKGNKKKQAAK